MKTATFILFAVFIIGATAGECGPNETILTITRCDKVCYSDERLCAPKDSQQKCFCKFGYQRLARDFAAPCVRSKECVQCGKNQEYKMCGPKCPEYCGMPEGKVCTTECVQGCFCKESYVLRSKDSEECIPKKDCPPDY